VRARLVEATAVTLAYAAVASFATWPLVRDPLGGFYGFGNDNWGGIPFLGWLHDAYLGPTSASFIPEFQAPFGLAIPEYAIQPLDRVFALLFGGFDQGLGAYNLQIFVSFVLAGCTMYLFARYVTGSQLAAFVAGFAYTFSPFHLALALQYNALAGIQWIPLYLLALLVLLRSGRLLHAALAGAAFALVAAGSYYYTWFLAWFTPLVVAAVAFGAAIRFKSFDARQVLRLGVTRAAVAVGTALMLLTPLLFTSARAAGDAERSTLEHPLSEAVRYSARPWMLFVPPLDNPIVGDRVLGWVNAHLYDSPVYEQSLYIGYALLALVAIALLPLGMGRTVSALKRGFLVAGALAGGLIMMGPYLPLDPDYWRLWATPEQTTHLPSLGRVMFELAPVFRFFTRSYVLFSACLVGLGAIGFARLEHRLGPSLLRRGALAIGVVALMGLEYTNAPPHLWFSDKSPSWVSAVKKLPDDATIMHYPAAAAFSPRSLYYMFWQTKHRRSITQPAVEPAAQGFAAATISPDDSEAGRALHDAGVDFVVVHTNLPPQTTFPYQPILPPDAMPADAGSLNPWFTEASRTPDAILYRVLDSPRRITGAIARPTKGFGAAEPEGGTTARWLEKPRGELAVTVSGPKRELTFRLETASFAQPRRVAIQLDDRPVGAIDVPVTYESFAAELGVVTAGRHTITLIPMPGPQSIAEATGQDDPRSVSIRIRGPVKLETPERR
jgi:hypothetical protein